jgi:hypothetical protein
MTPDVVLAAIRTISIEAKLMQGVRNDFEPIYEYYFPAGWGAVLKRALRLSPQPDFRRYDAELTSVKESAWDIIARTKVAYETVQHSQADDDLKQWAELAHRQIYLDGSSMMIFREFCARIASQDSDAMRYIATFRAWTRDAAANIRLLESATTSVAHRVGTEL